MITLALIILLTTNGTISLGWGLTLSILTGVGLMARLATWIMSP